MALDREIVIDGISASPGICIGKAYLVENGGVEIVEKYFISDNQFKNEIRRFKAAVKKSRDELHEIIAEGTEDVRQNAVIIETQEVLLKDKMLYDRTIEAIKKERINAEWALKKVVTKVKAMFQNISDTYLQERAADIVQVSDRIMRNLSGSDQVDIRAIDKRVILVARDLSPAETSQIQLERVKGFVTDRGGKTSHTSIVARTLEIPAVLGLDNATKLIKNDDLLAVDGTTGKVIIHPAEQTLIEYEERKSRYESLKAEMTRSSYLPAITTDGLHLKVLANIELPEEAVPAIDYGGEGIGLYRTEFQYLNRLDFPGEEELYAKYREVIEVMAPRPVTIRTLDINGDKAVAFAGGSKEENPALGLRAIRYCLKKPEIFKTQLRAIYRAAVHGNVRIMFPMISAYFEMLEIKRLIRETVESLEKDGLDHKADIKIGIMIEVPAMVILADLMAREVDFFSIGTNDLIQYALAIDRGNREVAHLFQALDPAVIRMIKRVTDVAKEKGIKTFICGEMAAYPLHTPLLLGLGLDGLSMNPQAIPAVKQMIRSLNIEDARSVVKEVLKKTTATSIFKVLQGVYGSLLTDEL